jgi:hypothetical protein
VLRGERIKEFRYRDASGIGPAAMLANRLSVRVGPTDAAESRFRLFVLNGENGR